ncbi:MAG: nitrate/nitrite transporter NrtS [Pseudomonadales bacterium]
MADTKTRSESWLATAARPDIVKRSLRVGLLVGTLLALINHGDRLLHGDIDAVAMVKILLTYLVPFAVSTWASVQTARADRAAV